MVNLLAYSEIYSLNCLKLPLKQALGSSHFTACLIELPELRCLHEVGFLRPCLTKITGIFGCQRVGSNSCPFNCGADTAFLMELKLPLLFRDTHRLVAKLFFMGDLI